MSQMQPYNRPQGLNPSDLAAKKKLIMDMIPQFRKALPDFFNPERFARVCCTLLVPKDERDVRRVQALLSCSPNTFFGALLGCAQLGLEPDGLLGQAYLIPYGNQIQLIIGYRGLIDLARRSGDLTSLIAHSIHENDTFSFDFGTCELPHHTFSLQQPRGEVIAFYAIARFKDGSYHFDLMTKGEVDAIRSRSKAGNSGPWVTDYEEMGKKTVIRRISKYLPMSVQRACSYDGSTVKLTADNEIVVEPPTFEVIENEPEQEPEEAPKSKLGARIPKAKKEEPEKSEIVNPIFEEDSK